MELFEAMTKFRLMKTSTKLITALLSNSDKRALNSSGLASGLGAS